MTRAACLFFGLYTLANIARALLTGGMGENVVWVDLRGLPDAVELLLLSVAAGLLAGSGLFPNAGRARRAATIAVAAALGAVAARDAVRFALLAGGTGFLPAVPLPFSLFVVLVLGATVVAQLRRSAPRPPVRLRVVLSALLLAVLFPLAQMACFGTSDYRRPADAAVVFGARAYADGKPSRALADRVRTACDLYHQGHVGTLVMSGGPGDGEVHESEAMRCLAIRLGVPEEVILLDRKGLSTTATVRNVCRISKERGWPRILAVSHAYHLPRVKMAFRDEGRTAYTVPAKRTLRNGTMARLILREVAAYWAVWLGA